LINRNAEPHLRSLDESRRHVTVEDLSQEPLPLPVSDFHRQGQSPRQLCDPMVEEWRAGLEADAHRGAIDLVQNVIRQVGERVPEHHAMFGIQCRTSFDWHVELRRQSMRSAYNIDVSRPGCRQSPVQLIDIIHALKTVRELVGFLAEPRDNPAGLEKTAPILSQARVGRRCIAATTPPRTGAGSHLSRLHTRGAHR
jgi:hypothetical protein